MHAIELLDVLLLLLLLLCLLEITDIPRNIGDELTFDTRMVLPG